MTPAWLEALASSEEFRRASELFASTPHLSLYGLVGPLRLAVPLLLAKTALLVVTPSERDVDGLTDDVRTLVAEMGLPGAVLAFPAPGPSPFRGLSRHPEASLRRAAVLHAASRGQLRAVIASAPSLLRPVLSPGLFETRILSLRRGDEMTPEILLESLDEGGYRREDPVTSAGQIAKRGGIFDVFPPDRDRPVRLEFLGDTIESLRSFDPETQRSLDALEAMEVGPLADLFPTRSTIARLKELLTERFSSHRDLEAFLERLDRGLLPEETVELLPLVPGATVPAWNHFQGVVAVSLESESIRLEADAYHARARLDRERRSDALALEPDEALVPARALLARLEEAPSLSVSNIDTGGASFRIPSRPVRRYGGDLKALEADLRAQPGGASLYLGNAGRAQRLGDVLREEGLPVSSSIEVRVGNLSSGFEVSGHRVFADGDLFPEEVHVHSRRVGRGARSFLSDFRDLRIGDLVVHQDHGIGRFEGLETLELAGIHHEFMVLVYQGGDKLKVPVEAFDRIQKYGSVEGARPAIDRLGSGSWEKVKTRVKKAMRDMAAELLRLYAQRKARPGHAFTAESPWQSEFEESFEYEETPDQATAIQDVAADMAAETPMDRLICGDVGYGKTEVAMRAAMRAVLDTKQVAVLAPTTVLAFQHWKTFRKRFAPFPVTVEMVSRFRKPKEVAAILERVGSGGVDILIGTHRILSKDVSFRDLGLVIVDEEQRFGVAAKEKLKHLRATIDCLTLSATPIPRTLQMGLSGIRDMSVIETPPKDRLAIQTSILKFSTDIIATTIRQEIARDGQVYLVHNRVESIYSLANLVTRLCPEVRVGVAHGQMPEKRLEAVMLAFVEGRIDVLVSTTIIENGLDIPRVNTLIVNRADRYGLSQLYQLRGRVGRSDRRAYAYLLVPPDKVLSQVASRRLAAIQEFSELGAGFRIAALDLELRGAGNLLGGQQSGHIQAVGLDLYVKLLEEAVLELKGEAPRERARPTLNLKAEVRIPPEYVPDIHQRMSLYKRLSQVIDEGEIESLRGEIRDRYGPLPREADELLAFAAQRLRAERVGISQVDWASGALHVRFSPEPALSPEALVALVGRTRGASLTPQGLLRVGVQAGVPPLAALQELLGALEASAPV